MHIPLRSRVAIAGALALAAVLMPSRAHAHCDRLDGPVAQAARAALADGAPAAVLIWVAPPQEAELREAFELASKAREEGAEAAALAERYLIETAVRLHRQAEGMPYQGVQPAGLELSRDLLLGERALEEGDLEPVLALLTEEMHRTTRDLFVKAREARAHREESVEAGRAWVDAYVRYIVFVHDLAKSLESGPAHGVGHAH